MSKLEAVELEGTVVNCLKGAMFEVSLNDMPDKIVLCSLSGKMRTNYIRILKGDSVTIEVSPYDFSKGRITWRNK